MASEHPNHTQVQVYKATHKRIKTRIEFKKNIEGKKLSANSVISDALDLLDKHDPIAKL